jgi:NADH-quinone oxidoreductase subunit K
MEAADRRSDRGCGRGWASVRQIFAIFIMTVAAADAAVGLAIVIAVYRLRRTVAVDAANTLQG